MSQVSCLTILCAIFKIKHCCSTVAFCIVSTYFSLLETVCTIHIFPRWKYYVFWIGHVSLLILVELFDSLETVLSGLRVSEMSSTYMGCERSKSTTCFNVSMLASTLSIELTDCLAFFSYSRAIVFADSTTFWFCTWPMITFSLLACLCLHL